MLVALCASCVTRTPLTFDQERSLRERRLASAVEEKDSGNAEGCLSVLDQMDRISRWSGARSLRPHTDAGRVRAICMMMGGECEEGRARLEQSLVEGFATRSGIDLVYSSYEQHFTRQDIDVAIASCPGDLAISHARRARTGCPRSTPPPDLRWRPRRILVPRANRADPRGGHLGLDGPRAHPDPQLLREVLRRCRRLRSGAGRLRRVSTLRGDHGGSPRLLRRPLGTLSRGVDP